MIVARDLVHAYPGGGFTLRVPALDLAEGERLAVVGPSGSGKSTLLDLIAGIRTPEAGVLTVDGVDVPALSQAGRRAFRAARIGFVFQTFELIDYLTARDNILYPFMISPALRLDGAVRARAVALAQAAGVANRLDRRPADLSQGERQRVAICRALIARPRLILADEATGNLDPASKGVALDLLFGQAAQAGAAVLAVTHDHALLPRFDRVVDFADIAGRAAA